MAPGSILFALVALLPGLGTSQYCARFEFPDLPDQTVTATEDSYITIPFRLVFEPFTPHQATPTPTTTIATSTGSGSKNQKCLRKKAFLVLVTRAGKGKHSSRPPMDYCVLRVSRSGHCLSFSRQRRCVCHGGRRIWEEAAKGGGEGGGGGVGGGVGGGGAGGGGDGGGDGDGGGTSDGGGLALLFTRKVRREDEGLWWWWTQEEVAAPAEVFLKVSDHIATTVTTAATTATTTTNTNNTATTTSNINNNRSSSSRIKAEKLDTGTQGDQSAYDDDEDEEDSDDGSKAPVVNVSHITAMVAGVNIFTIFIIGIVVLTVRQLRCSKRGRGRPRPAPPLCQRKATGERRHYDVAAVSSASEKRLSTSSRLYDEISDDVTTLINSDTSLYLHPISCNTDTTTVPVITFATITNAK